MNNEYEMDKELLDKFTDATNRSKGQTSFLFNLVKGDFLKLVELEERLKNNHLSYCPGDEEEVEKVLCMDKYGNKWFNLDLFRK